MQHGLRMKTEMSLVEYAEQKGIERLDFELESKGNLYEEATRLFNLMTFAIAGCIGYLFTQINADKSPTLVLVVVATIVHLAATAIYVMHKALGIRDIAPRGNEPSNLLKEGNEKFPLDGIRRTECDNIEASIRQNLARNQKTAKAIKRGRILLVLSPLTSLAAWAVAAICGLA